MNDQSEAEKLKPNTVYYLGDVNPEYGGVIAKSDSDGVIDCAITVGEFSPISYAFYIQDINFLESITSIEGFAKAYYEDQAYENNDYSDGFYFMKSIYWEYTNESDKDMIDKFVRYDYNIWNLLKKKLGVPRHTKVH